MGMQASAPAELRGAMGRPSYLSAGGPKAMFVVNAGCTDAIGTRMSAADHRIVDGGTQHHPLSAALNNPPGVFFF